MSVKLLGRRDIHFRFSDSVSRDQSVAFINSNCARASEPSVRTNNSRGGESKSLESDPGSNTWGHDGMKPSQRTINVRPRASDALALPKNHLPHLPEASDEAIIFSAFVANRPCSRTPKVSPRRFTLLTIGSRGDVQPYISLGLRLMEDGHKVVIVTHRQ